MIIVNAVIECNSFFCEKTSTYRTYPVFAHNSTELFVDLYRIKILYFEYIEHASTSAHRKILTAAVRILSVLLKADIITV